MVNQLYYHSSVVFQITVMERGEKFQASLSSDFPHFLNTMVQSNVKSASLHTWHLLWTLWNHFKPILFRALGKTFDESIDETGSSNAFSVHSTCLHLFLGKMGMGIQSSWQVSMLISNHITVSTFQQMFSFPFSNITNQTKWSTLIWVLEVF